jgi:hypothetical protein
LERPLFAAGSVVYVAPLWPVPTILIQNVLARLLENWFASPDRAVAQHVADLRASNVQCGISPLAARAFGVFGDGL